MDRETNRYWLHRAGIAALAEANGYDADTACVIFAKQQGWTGSVDELRDFRREMRNAQLNKGGSLYDLFYSARADIRREKAAVKE